MSSDANARVLDITAIERFVRVAAGLAGSTSSISSSSSSSSAAAAAAAAAVLFAASAACAARRVSSPASSRVALAMAACRSMRSRSATRRRAAP